jgi:hypothetical protein
MSVPLSALTAPEEPSAWKRAERERLVLTRLSHVSHTYTCLTLVIHTRPTPTSPSCLGHQLALELLDAPQLGTQPLGLSRHLSGLKRQVGGHKRIHTCSTVIHISAGRRNKWEGKPIQLLCTHAYTCALHTDTHIHDALNRQSPRQQSSIGRRSTALTRGHATTCLFCSSLLARTTPYCFSTHPHRPEPENVGINYPHASLVLSHPATCLFCSSLLPPLVNKVLPSMLPSTYTTGTLHWVCYTQPTHLSLLFFSPRPRGFLGCGLGSPSLLLSSLLGLPPLTCYLSPDRGMKQQPHR